MASFREVYAALMTANGLDQTAIGKALGHDGNGMVRAVIFAEKPKEKRSLPLDELEAWIAALKETTRAQRETLRDLAYRDYAPAYAKQWREQAKELYVALVALRELLIQRRVDVPQSLEDTLTKGQMLLGD